MFKQKTKTPKTIKQFFTTKHHKPKTTIICKKNIKKTQKNNKT